MGCVPSTTHIGGRVNTLLLDKYAATGFQKKTFYFIVFLLLTAIVSINDVTKFKDFPPRWIGHGDQANTANVARNIAEGNGPVTDSIWLLTNGGIKGAEIPTPEPYWSIYVAAIISIFFCLFSASLTVLLIPAVLIKAGVAWLGAAIAYKLNKSYLAAFAVGIFLLCHSSMTKSANGLSDIYLTFFVLLTAIALIYANIKSSIYLFALAGLFTGISIGIKPSGILLIGLVLSYSMFARRMSSLVRIALPFLLGMIIGVAPLIIHNQKSFGSFVSPGYGLVIDAAKISFLTKNPNNGLYNPEPHKFTEQEIVSLSNGERELRNFKNFIVAFFSGEIFPIVLLPLSLFAILSYIRKLKLISICGDPGFDKHFAFISAQLMIAAFALGFSVHMEERYWNFIVPFLAILSIVTLEKWSKMLTIVVIVLVAVSYINATKRYNAEPIPKGFITAAKILPIDAIVLTSDPWEFAFHTRRKSVMLPYTDKPAVLNAIRDRYGAGYIAIINGRVRHSFYDPIISGSLPEYLEPFYVSKELIVVKFKAPLK